MGSLNKSALVRHVEGLASKYKRDEHYYDSGGGYYPLSCYKNQGYTPDELKNLEKNLRMLLQPSTAVAELTVSQENKKKYSRRCSNVRGALH